MSFALTPFATHPFGTTALTGPMTSSGVGSAAGTSTAAAVSDLWGAVVFQADFDPVNPAGQVTSPVVDYKGHTVLKGSYPRVTPDTGNIYNSTGGGHLRGQTGTGNIAYVDGLLSEFNGFRLTDKWTLEFRLLVKPSWVGWALSIQAATGGSPLTVRVDTTDTAFGILVKPQNQSTAYATGQIYTAEAYTWHSFIVECNGSSVKIIHDTTQATTTTDTSLSYNSAVANSLTLLGLSKDHSGSLLYLDELRITKAARYGGSGYPASPWPYYNGREGWSFTGSSAGTSTASAVGVAATDTTREGYGLSAGVATAIAVHLPVSKGSCAASSVANAQGIGFGVASGTTLGTSTATAYLHGGDTAYATAQGTSVVTGAGWAVNVRPAAGLSQSTSTATAYLHGGDTAYATAQGTSVVTGMSAVASVRAFTGLSQGSSTASGRPSDVAKGVASGGSSAEGRGAIVSYGVGESLASSGASALDNVFLGGAAGGAFSVGAAEATGARINPLYGAASCAASVFGASQLFVPSVGHVTGGATCKSWRGPADADCLSVVYSPSYVWVRKVTRGVHVSVQR